MILSKGNYAELIFEADSFDPEVYEYMEILFQNKKSKTKLQFKQHQKGLLLEAFHLISTHVSNLSKLIPLKVTSFNQEFLNFLIERFSQKSEKCVRFKH